MNKTNVGIIGCGTIGSHLAKGIDQEFRRDSCLKFLCDSHLEKAEALRKKFGRGVLLLSIPELIQRSDLIIEAASSKAAGEIATRALAEHKQVLIMSVGGLLSVDLPKIAAASRGKLWVPSGAIAGVDALLAAREGEIKGVRLVTRKPPAALKGAPYFSKKKFPALGDGGPVCVFKGTAAEALRGFPQNINVAAVLSLAGIGAKMTAVEIWTAADFSGNRHEVTIEGDFGTIQTVTNNVPAPENLKTSYLAVLSAAATLRKIFSSLRIGT